MTRTLSIDDMPVFERLRDLLDELERDPVKQQTAIELLMVRHAAQASRNQKEYFFIIDSMAKHARQLRTNVVG